MPCAFLPGGNRRNDATHFVVARLLATLLTGDSDAFARCRGGERESRNGGAMTGACAHDIGMSSTGRPGKSSHVAPPNHALVRAPSIVDSWEALRPGDGMPASGNCRGNGESGWRLAAYSDIDA